MQVVTRTSPTTGSEVAPTVRRRRSKRLMGVLMGTVIVAVASLGILRNDGEGDGPPKPSPATVSVEPAGSPVIPFPVVPPATGDGVSSVDG